jgi:polyphosphate kinase
MEFIDREISWLYFNSRVLQEAESPDVPLQERIRFLGIFSNNLDEFYRVRVASISRLIELNKTDFPEKADYYTTILNRINTISYQQHERIRHIFDTIQKELEKHNIYLINEKQLTEKQGKYIRILFREKIRSHLFPIILKNLFSPGTLKDSSIYLAVVMSKPNALESKQYAIIEIPVPNIERFIVLPTENDNKYVIRLDDIIRYCLDDIFGVFGYTRFSAYTFKLTRDGELDIDEDISKSFMELLTESIKQREIGEPVRFIYDKDMPENLLTLLMSKLNIGEQDHPMQGGRYHNSKDLMKFPNLAGPDLSYPITPPLPHKDIPIGKKVISAIRDKDILLHFPYQSFQYIIDLLREASIDSKVRSIKMTLYRIANPSRIVNALINASRNGKSVTVFMEFQARFDEENNIFWSTKLQESGVRIIKAIPGFKVHSKLILIRRKEKGLNRYYANISTGNFNEQTAKVYCDDSLLTADPKITEDIQKVFYLFEKSYRLMRFRHLVVSPFKTRNHFLKLLSNEISNAREGKPAWVMIKMNSLSDEKLSRKLYKAAKEGVKISLIIRGINIMIPNHPNIEAISIVDKYLEHSRIFAFCNNDINKFFIGSADWMTRNLDNRIEVTTPIFNLELQQELKTMLEIQLRDNIKARLINSKGLNSFKKTDGEDYRAQKETYNFLKQVHKPE